MDDSCILKLIPSKSLREYLYSSLPERENTPETIRNLRVLDPNAKTDSLLTVYDIKWLHTYIEDFGTNDDVVQFCELMKDTQLLLPSPVPTPRNPELEARIQRLKAEQADRAYMAMTRSVDAARYREPEESIGAQIKALNRQLIAIVQFIFSVGAGFVFGFLGVELMVGDLDFGFRLLLGVIIALIIALAEIYFLAKKLNEEYYTADEGRYNCGTSGIDDNIKQHQE